MTGKVKKQIILNLPYLIFVYLFDKLCQGVRLAPGADASEKLLHIGQGFSAAFTSLAPSFHLLDLCVGAAGAVLIRLVVYSKGKNAKKYRRGMEYGSARWGTPADIAPYVDKDFSQNVLLTQTERITMSSRPKEPKYARNKNILVIGGSGSGKTRFFVKPNLLQCHSSYVVTDPKGTILQEVGALLERRQYRIKSLNLINFKKSMRYNPLAYIRSEKDILKLVNALILTPRERAKRVPKIFGSRPSGYTILPSSATFGMRRSRRSATSSPCWTLSTHRRPERMTRSFSPRWICCLPSWKRSSRIISP